MTDGPEPRSVLSRRFSTEGRTYSRPHVRRDNQPLQRTGRVAVLVILKLARRLPGR